MGSGWGSGWRCGVWVRVRGRVRVQGGGWRAWLVELEATTTEGTTATLADPLAIDQKAGRAWPRPIDERCKGLHHERGAHH